MPVHGHGKATGGATHREVRSALLDVNRSDPQPSTGRDENVMKRALAGFMTVAFVFAFTPVTQAQTTCPQEVTTAKDMLAKKGGIAKSQDIQAPRSLAGARQDVQAPRSQD